jgi:tetratricopeptide (TPR) repeat protein
LQVYGPFPFQFRIGPGFGLVVEDSPSDAAPTQTLRPNEPTPAEPLAEELLAPPAVSIPSTAGSPPASPADLMTVARDSLRSANYEAAVRALHEQLAIDPRSSEALLLTAHALFGLEAFPQAADTLRSALAVAPKQQWGEIVRDHRRYFASAVEYSDRLRAREAYTAQHPNEANAHLLLAYHYGYLGLRSDALSELDRASAIAPNDSLATALGNEFRQRPTTPAQPVSEGPTLSQP